nr:SH3 domain-containing protein [Aestuariibacter salexigens]
MLDKERADDGQDDSVFEATSKLVNASRLNVREGPGAQFDKVTEPLSLGTNVKVLQQKQGWSQVEFTLKGWVSSKYLT